LADLRSTQARAVHGTRTAPRSSLNDAGVPIWWQKHRLVTDCFSLSSLWMVTAPPHCCRIETMTADTYVVT